MVINVTSGAVSFCSQLLLFHMDTDSTTTIPNEEVTFLYDIYVKTNMFWQHHYPYSKKLQSYSQSITQTRLSSIDFIYTSHCLKKAANIIIDLSLLILSSPHSHWTEDTEV